MQMDMDVQASGSSMQGRQDPGVAPNRHGASEYVARVPADAAAKERGGKNSAFVCTARPDVELMRMVKTM